MIDRFDGTIGVVTGSASGIGRQIALQLSELGMQLALVDLDARGLAETARLTGASERHRTLRVDVADREAVDWAVAEIVAELGEPGLLVNCAGRLGPIAAAVWELTPSDWADVLGSNLHGSVNLARALVPVMMAASPRPAHIVTIASIVGIVPDGRLGAYAAAKHALVSFTETLRLELAARGSDIGVTLVCPAGVPTNLNAAARSRGVASRPPGDWLTAEEVAKQVIDAMRLDRFYVFTHSTSEAVVRRYQQNILDAFGT